MKKLLPLAIALAMASPATSETVNQVLSSEAKPAEVLVFGTYHFLGSKTDLNSVSDPLLGSEFRQQELRALHDKLIDYSPTKILVEVPTEKQNLLDQAFTAWSNDPTADLPGGLKGEILHVAFPLAKSLGHEKLWAIDHKIPMKFGEIMERAEQFGQKQLLDDAFGLIQPFLVEWRRMIREDGMLPTLCDANDRKTLEETHSLYMVMAEVGQGEDYIGADQLADWFRRNLIIFQNLTRISNDQDRLFVLFGAGHSKYLRDFINESPRFTEVDPNEWIPNCHR